MFVNRITLTVLAAACLWIPTATVGAATYTWEMDATEDQVNNAGTVDGSTDSAATGHALISYDTETGLLSYTIDWQGLEGLLTAIHLHGPATASQSVMPHLWNVFTAEADVIAAGVDRTSDVTSDSADFDQVVLFSRSPFFPDEVLVHMLDELGYVNIHSSLWPMGEIRAHLVLTDVVMDLTRSHRRCVRAQNRNFARVSRRQRRLIRGCLRRRARGTLAGTVESCLLSDPGGRIDAARTRAAADFERRCAGVDGKRIRRLPLFGATDAATIGSAAVAAELSLAHALFGPDLDAAVPADDPTTSSCQRAVYGAIDECQRRRYGQYNECKRRGLRGRDAPAGASLPFDDAADLELCMDADPAGVVAGACDPTGGRLAARVIPARCARPGADLSDAVPGCGTDDAAQLAACIDRLGRCYACTGLNAADALSRDCDLFDDGAANGSCP